MVKNGLLFIIRSCTPTKKASKKASKMAFYSSIRAYLACSVSITEVKVQ